MRLDEGLYVFLAVIVSQLFSGFNRLDGKDVHPILDLARLAIGSTGVVDVPSQVFSGPAGYGLTVAQVEQVAAIDFVGCLIVDYLAPVFNDEAVFRDVRPSVQTQTGHGTTDSDRIF